LISNAILDHRDWTKHNYSKLAEEFNQIGCKALQLRFFDDESIEKIAEVVSQFDDTRIRHIDILAKYNDSLNEANLRDLCFQYSRISYFVLFESPIETEYKCHNSNATLYFIEDKISGAHHCGKIASSSFKVSTELFIESNNYNSCLNKKISVDEQGFIKNCPSMAGNYGHHQEVSLKSVAETDKFKEYWKISKSQITTCKVCEFRHVCTDCRAYLEMPTDRYSKPLKCGYNPYTAEWEVWSDNPLKRETAEHYNLNNG
jgi:SPASM domain peptide maturase of grasp-with-spasm system